MAGDPRVLELLEEILGAGRTPEEACHACPELLPEVRRRWEAFRRVDEQVCALVPGLGTLPLEKTNVPGAADRVPQIAGYELLGEIGRGGMGVVHRAKDLALDRDVAVKLLQDRYPIDSSIARRFIDEARITAQLQHPGVPAVYRVAELPDGRPFLAMKLIKGRTLAEMLALRPDPASDRGRLVAIFEQVCLALAYAHSLRVIHRDLKPSNVMVGKFGEVQVMDWGLAKVLSDAVPAGREPRQTPPPADDGTVIRTRTARAADTPGEFGGLTPETQAGSVLGTPAYMAPEQAGGELDRVDERADVFGLGAVLCEILTGKPPYAGRDDGEIVRKALAANQADARARLALCGAEPELVGLCLRCLATEPDDRPADAGKVANAVAELRSAAEDRARRAVLSRVQSAEQGKRRRVLLKASGVIAVVLLAGLSVSLFQTRRALLAEAAAISSADQARLNAEESERNAQRAQVERDAKATALAAEQQARRDETKARQRAFEALRTMTAEVVESKFAQGAALSEDDRAFLRGVIAQFDAFAAIRGDGAESRAVRAEGRLRVAWMRYRLGEIQEAEQDYDEAIRICNQLAAEFPSRLEFRQDLAGSYTNRGILLRATGRLNEAEKDWNEALSIHKQLAADFPSRPEFRRELANGYNNRGVLRRETGRQREAEEDYYQALSIRKQLANEFPSRPEFRQVLAGTYLNRAILLRDAHRYKEADEEYGRAIIIQKQLTAEFPSRPELRQELANCRNSRGSLLTDMGRFKEAEADYDEALAIRRQLAGDFPNRPEFRQKLANSFANRGTLLRATDRTRKAEQDFEQALSIYTRLAADFPTQPDLRNELAGTYVNLASLNQVQGNWAAAKRLLMEGRPHHLAALEANSRHPSYRQFYRTYLSALIAAHAGLREQEDAVRAAETFRDLGWDPPADAYDAACALSLCVPIMTKHDKLDDKQRHDATQFYGDAAMRFLRDAVGKGFNDAAHIKKDTDLDSLRTREDFQKLVTELEAKAR